MDCGDASVVSVSFFCAGGMLTGLVVLLLLQLLLLECVVGSPEGTVVEGVEVVLVSGGKMEESGALLCLLLNWWRFPSAVVAALWGVVVAGSTGVCVMPFPVLVEPSLFCWR